MKRLQRPVLIIILLAGIAMALWPAGERVYGWWNQRALQAAWHDTVNQATPSSASHQPGQQKNTPSSKRSNVITVSSTTGSIPPLRGAPSAKASSRPKPRTWLPTKISIPDINLDAIVVQGIGPEELRQGPGHDPASALPGEKGNCVIAAHRNAYGWWFYRLDRVEVDSVVQLQTRRELLTYRVVLNRVVDETDLSLLQPTDSAQLTLYTCTLPKSDQRIVVVANLVSRQPS